MASNLFPLTTKNVKGYFVMSQPQIGCHSEQARKFDFMIGDWTVHNRLKYQGNWMEFEAHNHGEQYLDGCTIIDTFDAILPSGTAFKGITIRAYDKNADHWYINWLDNRVSPRFDPLIGKFNDDGIGEFTNTKINDDSSETHIRFVWDNISESTARWRQFISHDTGETWDMTWVMEFSRD